MKKTVLLLLMASGVSYLASAQSNNNSVAKEVDRACFLKFPAYYSPNAENPSKSVNSNTTKPVVSNHNANRVAQTQTVTKIKCATSDNLFSALTAACTQVTVNADLGMIAFTHREDMSLPYKTGAYETDYSLDGGTTWDTAKAIVNKYDSTRYPNGVILNPAGNSNPAMAYAVSTGPHTNGTAWDSVVSASVRLDGANVMENRVQMYPLTPSSALTVFSPPHYMTVCNDSTVHSVQEAWTLNSAQTLYQGFYGAVINTGTWSSTTHSLTWTDTVLRPHFASSDGPSAPYDSDAEVSSVSMAWSQDGMVGYVVFFGNLDSTGYNYASMQPVVYKTADHGTTWNMMPMFNFRHIPNLVQYLRPAPDSAFSIPFWDINGDSSGYYAGHDEDVTVDSSYNLHIFGAIEPGAIANPDSGGYEFDPAFSGGRYIYDVYTTSPTGGWKATLIDSLTSKLGSPNNGTQWYNANVGGFGARIQASRTPTGGKVFCTWEDDFYSGTNQIVTPDIMTAEIDASTGNLTGGPARVTMDGDNFYLNASDIAYYNGGCWNIPCTVVLDPSPSNGLNPIEYLYVQGVCVTAGINEVTSSTPAFSVSPNYPDPFSKTTRFNVTLSRDANVSVDVFNLVGQKVESASPEKMTPGKHTLTINGSSLKAGLYFYRVTVNNQSVTHKMVIQ